MSGHTWSQHVVWLPTCWLFEPPESLAWEPNIAVSKHFQRGNHLSCFMRCFLQQSRKHHLFVFFCFTEFYLYLLWVLAKSCITTRIVFQAINHGMFTATNQLVIRISQPSTVCPLVLTLQRSRTPCLTTRWLLLYRGAGRGACPLGHRALAPGSLETVRFAASNNSINIHTCKISHMYLHIYIILHIYTYT